MDRIERVTAVLEGRVLTGRRCRSGTTLAPTRPGERRRWRPICATLRPTISTFSRSWTTTAIRGHSCLAAW